MTIRSLIRSSATCLALIALLTIPVVGAHAREESKIMLDFESAGGGLSPSASGKAMSMMSIHRATLQVMLRRLDGSTEYALLSDGEELTRFTTNSRGFAVLRVDLLTTGDLSSPPIDPRGKLLTVNDGVNDVLQAWVMADPLDDPKKVRIKEWTSLEPDPAFVDVGTASARYMLLPNGRVMVFVQVVRAPVSMDYELLVDGVSAATFTPNPAGVANIMFRSTGAWGRSLPHNQKLGIEGFEPRNGFIEIRPVGSTDVYFSGEMLAQIPGLNVCTFSERMVMMSLGPDGQLGDAADMKLGVEDDCDRFLDVVVTSLGDGTYDIAVDGSIVAAGALSVSGGVGEVQFETNAEDPGVLELDFDLASGSVVTVEQTGAVMLQGIVP
jgi:hypothetical protein